jgi:hypothetical protein
MNTSDADGSIISWSLDVDNDGIVEYSGIGAPPATQQHVYDKEGNYTAKLTVIDNEGAEAYDIVAIEVFSPINHAPVVEIIKPLNGSIVSLNPKLSVSVSDEDKDTVTVTFYDIHDNIIGRVENVSSGSFAEIIWKNLQYETNYGWYVVVSDGKESVKSKTYYFSTISPPQKKDYKYYLYILPFIALLAGLITYFYLIKRKGKLVVEVQEENRCLICLGKFKDETKSVRCDCGATFHKSCASRVKECPECGKKL